MTKENIYTHISLAVIQEGIAVFPNPGLCVSSRLKYMYGYFVLSYYVFILFVIIYKMM